MIKVEVSTDGGATWGDAQLLGEAVPYAWRLWENYWRTPSEPTACTLMARATDTGGNVQPMQRDSHRGAYMITHVQPIEIEVRKMSDARASEAYNI